MEGGQKTSGLGMQVVIGYLWNDLLPVHLSNKKVGREPKTRLGGTEAKVFLFGEMDKEFSYIQVPAQLQSRGLLPLREGQEMLKIHHKVSYFGEGGKGMLRKPHPKVPHSQGLPESEMEPQDQRPTPPYPYYDSGTK